MESVGCPDAQAVMTPMHAIRAAPTSSLLLLSINDSPAQADRSIATARASLTGSSRSALAAAVPQVVTIPGHGLDLDSQLRFGHTLERGDVRAHLPFTPAKIHHAVSLDPAESAGRLGNQPVEIGRGLGFADLNAFIGDGRGRTAAGCTDVRADQTAE
ncbi:MAG TPA: hypothetical protein VFO82_04530 [Steroidobacteraceae bacterium]|nr:hypothetical protein [Steroidobacteraceae bacterium]